MSKFSGPNTFKVKKIGVFVTQMNHPATAMGRNIGG
jgi:hypothetical protein